MTISKSQFSFGRALNIGCGVARYPFVCKCPRSPGKKQLAAHNSIRIQDERVGLVYGRQRAGETNKFSNILLQSWFPDKVEKYQKSAFCSNANCAIRKKLWVKNKYDETLTGLEDIAWATIIKQQIGKSHTTTMHRSYTFTKRIGCKFIDDTIVKLLLCQSSTLAAE